MEVSIEILTKSNAPLALAPATRQPTNEVAVTATGPSPPRPRTMQQEEQVRHREDEREGAGNHVFQLITRHTCTSDQCPNHSRGGSCYVRNRGPERGQHFALTEPMKV